MASILPRGDKYFAQVAIQGVRKSKSCKTMTEAKAWAAKTETDILAGINRHIPDKTFGELLTRYADEISPKKKGAHWELVRIEAIKRDKIARTRLQSLDERDMSVLRDRLMARRPVKRPICLKMGKVKAELIEKVTPGR